MSKDKELWKQQERRNTLHTKLLPQTSGGFLNRKKFFINLFYQFIYCSLFLVSNPFVEDWLSIDRSEGAALRGMKPRSRSRLSTNGLAPASPRTCGVWWARGRPPFQPHPMSQEEGLSTLNPGSIMQLGAPHRYLRDAGLNRKVLRRGENGMIYSKYWKKKCQPIILYPAQLSFKMKDR